MLAAISEVGKISSTSRHVRLLIIRIEIAWLDGEVGGGGGGGGIFFFFFFFSF